MGCGKKKGEKVENEDKSRVPEPENEPINPEPLHVDLVINLRQGYSKIFKLEQTYLASDFLLECGDSMALFVEQLEKVINKQQSILEKMLTYSQ